MTTAILIIIIVSVFAIIALGIIQITVIKQLNKTIRSINSINRCIKKVKKNVHGQGEVIDLELQMICANANCMKEVREDLNTHARAIDKFGRMAITASNHAALVNTEWIKMNNKHVKKEGEKR